MRNLNPPLESCIMSLKPGSGSAFLQESISGCREKTCISFPWSQDGFLTNTLPYHLCYPHISHMYSEIGYTDSS